MNSKQRAILYSVRYANARRNYGLFAEDPDVTHDVVVVVLNEEFTLGTPGLDDCGDDFAELWTSSFNHDPEAQEAYFTAR